MLSLVGASDAIMLGAIEQSALRLCPCRTGSVCSNTVYFAIVIGAACLPHSISKGDKAAVEMIFAFV